MATQTPNAELVHDKFHVAKHLGEAVDQVRRGGNKALQAEDDGRLNGTRQLSPRSRPPRRPPIRRAPWRRCSGAQECRGVPCQEDHAKETLRGYACQGADGDESQRLEPSQRLVLLRYVNSNRLSIVGV